MKIAYSSTISSELMDRLDHYASKLGVPKNRLIEMSISYYLDLLKKAEYIRSFQRVNEDEEQLKMAEEGMGDFLELVDQYDS